METDQETEVVRDDQRVKAYADDDGDTHMLTTKTDGRRSRQGERERERERGRGRDDEMLNYRSTQTDITCNRSGCLCLFCPLRLCVV